MGRLGRYFHGRRVLSGFVAMCVCLAATAVLTRSASAAPGCGMIGYGYDAAGRLRGVSDQSDRVASYSYDASGNITGVVNRGQPDLWIHSLNPGSGPAGTPVTISGGCFSPNAADDHVLFGGVPATVTYASAVRLVAQVPAGAADGPVTVRLGGASATSDAPFSVTAGGGVSVSSVSPAVVAAGGTLTVAGAGFETDPLEDIVSLGVTRAYVPSAGAGQLSVEAPAGTVAGRVAVRTPRGEATSGTDVFVVPAPYGVADVAYTGRATLGAAQPIAIPTAGQIGMLAFDLADGQYATVNLTGGTFGQCGLNAYVKSPHAVTATSLSCVGSGGFIDRFGGTAGTWVLLLASQSATGSVSATVTALPPDPTAPATPGGAPVTVTTTAPGQNATVSFAGTAGHRASVNVSGRSYNADTTLTLRDPSGSAVTTTTFYSFQSSLFIEPQPLPSTGTYTVVVDPVGAASGSISVQVFDVPPDSTVDTTAGGAAVTASTTVPGQNATVTFAGTAGQRVSVNLSGRSYNADTTASLRGPDGSTVYSTTFYSFQSSLFIEPHTLPAAGTYTLYLDPAGTATGSLGAQVYDVPPDSTVDTMAGGAAVTASIAVPGQNAAVTFTGTAGQRVSVNLSGRSYNADTAVSLRGPDGSTVYSSSFYSFQSSLFVDPVSLPAAGTYTLYLDPAGTATGSVTVQVYDVPADSTVGATPGGAAVTATTTIAGQRAIVTFAGTAGQRVSVELSGRTYTADTVVSILSPDGTSLGGNTFYSFTSTDFVDTVTLPAAGTYTVRLDPAGTATGSVSVHLNNVPADATATLQPGGATVTVTTTTPGQNAVLPFAATAGDNVTVSLTNNTFGSTSFTLRAPDGSTVSSGSSSSSFTFGNVPLSAAGTYTVLVDPSGPATGSITAALFDVPSDATATATVGGPAVTIGTTTPGQNAVLSFAGTANQRVFTSLSGGTFGSGNATVTVRKPDGTTLLSGQSCGVSCTFDTTTLPVDGTYTILIDPSGSATGSITAQLYAVPADSTVDAGTGGTAVTATTTVPGQNTTVTFTGTAGHRASVNLTNRTYSADTAVTIVRPDGTTLSSTTFFSFQSALFVEPQPLAATGTYTIRLNPAGAVTGSVTALVSDVPADSSTPATPGGAAVTATTTVPGQNAGVTFSGTATQRVSVTVSGRSFSADTVVTVRKPDGTSLFSTTLFSFQSALFIEPQTLPTTGTYTVYLDPAGAATGSLTVGLYAVPADATTPATPGGAAVTATTTVPGQNAAVTFPGTATHRVSVNVSGRSFSADTVVTVRKPDGTSLFSTTFFSFQSSLFIEPQTLAATGTYTVYLDPAGTATGSLTVQLFDVPADASVAAIPGTAATATNRVAGQNVGVTFAGTAGQQASASLSGRTYSADTALTLRKPDGTTLFSGTFFAFQTSYSMAAQTLPVSGTYTLYLDPAGTATGSVSVALALTQPAVPARFTRADGPAPQPDTAESWTPDRFNLRGADWASHRAPVPAAAALRAADGVNAVAGRVLLLSGQPLPGVTLTIGTLRAQTRPDGRFLLTGVPAGHEAMLIDGRTASGPGRAFGVYEVGVDVTAGHTLVLPYTIWMTRLDSRHSVRFPSPTTVDTVITTPTIPGFEVRLPRGSVVKDEDGHVVTSLSITAVPVDRPPFPLPAGVVTPVYFTVQPGGSYVFPSGAQIVYPNTTGLAPGVRVPFYDYDPDGRGWYVYGLGTVTADGRQVVPDPGVRVWQFSGAMINVGGLTGPGDGPGDGGDSGGDPIDLGTGLFVQSHTDLVLPDVIPIALTRTYRQRDNARRPFGIGTNFTYGMFLQSANQYQEADLVYPDGGKTHLVRTSPGTGFSDAVFAVVDTTGPFRGATMSWNGRGWDLVRTDGMVYVFGENQPLQSIRDRHGNRVTITRTSGDQSGDITQVTSPNGRWIRLSYDSSDRITQATDNGGRTVRYQYDSGGRLVQVTSPGGSVTRYGYDSANEMTSVTDGRGITYLTNTYDSAGRVATQTVADGSAYQFAYTTDGSANITATAVTDPEGRTKTTTFDAGHRVVATTDATGTPLARSTTTVRDPSTHLPTSMTDPYGHVTTASYDAGGTTTAVTSLAGTPLAMTGTLTPGGPFKQLLAVADPAGNTTRYAYSGRGDVTSVTDAEQRVSTYTYDPSGQPTSVTDAIGNTTTFTYALGDLVAVTDPLGHTSRTFLDAVGRPVMTVDAEGGVRRYAYDADNNLLSQSDPAGNTTSYTHDANGNVTAVTDPRGHTTTIAFDPSDRVSAVTDPLGRTSRQSYDHVGRVVSATDAAGNTTVTRYDALGRVSFVGYGAGPGGTYQSTLTYAYDDQDRVTGVTDSTAGTVSLGYNDLDEVTSVTTPQGTIGYGYDALGRESSLTVPGQAPVSYNYDKTGLLSSLSQGSTVVSWQRDAAGRTTAVQRPGVTAAYSYDAASQLTGIHYTGPGGTEIGDLTYVHDPLGRVEGVLGSLAHVTIPSTGPPATYDAANELTSLGGQQYTYDADGNLTGDGTRSYTWNARGQLAGVTGPGLDASFGYDAAGRRINTTVNGTTTGYLYDGASLVQEQTSGAPSVNRLAGGPDLTLSRSDASGVTEPVTDGLGSVVGLVDGSGTLATQYSYDPYGQPTASGTASGNTQQYTGREYDAATGLQYNRARYYDPGTGRFISADPAGFSGGGTNLYQYGLSDPVNLSDPNGECPICIAVIIGFVIGGSTGVGMGWLTAHLTGRKYTFGDGLRDFLIWGTVGALTDGFGAWLRGGESVWALGWAERGLAIEEKLGGNLPRSFPVIDRFANGTATSIKSIDLAAPTYQRLSALRSLVKGYINKVAGFNGASFDGVTITASDISSRALDIAIPKGVATPAQMQVLQDMVTYGAGLSPPVTVIITVVP
ncbi:MAG TPA: pre-peptidase C-terminal domain-containing protein [Rugosimonospora sp.]|nr:pre-peptidase C-terminal domain-containing protein [Rugosimonospora sp.]